MRSLFIIGNGFDIAHGLKTSYQDFREYLINEYPESNEDEFIMPEVYMLPDGGEAFEDVDAVSFLMRLLSTVEGEKWKDVENSLGVLDFSECFDYIDYAIDSDGDIDFYKQVYLNEDIASNIVLPTIEVSRYFSDWINTIKIDNTITLKKDFKSLLKAEEDLFLTFNYTETLEKLYQVKNVCHIHGKLGEDLLFGHGNKDDYYENDMINYIGAENSLHEIRESLRKNTTDAIERNRSFFDSIDDSIDKIFSFGFSFSEVDLIYIKTICEKVSNPNVIWYLNDFDSEKQREEYQNRITKSGYIGIFGTYSIEK